MAPVPRAQLWHLYSLGASGVPLVRPLWAFVMAQCALGAIATGAAYAIPKK